jgi:hypothetical protein
MALGDGDIATLARNAGFSGNDVAIAVAVCLAESGGNPLATHINSNGSTDYGLWQINSVHQFPVSQLLDPAGNANAAYWVQRDSGWKAWSTYNSGAYQKYMSRGNAAAGGNAGTANGATTGAAGSSSSPGVNPVASGSAPTVLSSATMGGTWLRVGAFLLGTVLLVEGLLRMTGASKTIVEIGKDAAKDAAMGALA